MNQDLPRWVIVTISVVIGALALMVFLNFERLDVYRTYLREKSPEIQTRFNDLSVSMDEATVKQHFSGLAFRCMVQRAGEDDLGERVCYAPIEKADGEAALGLAALFNKSKLVRVIVQMPWWVLDGWAERSTLQYGEPKFAGRVSLVGGPVLRWTLPNGHLESNRDRSFNLLSWNVVIWTGR